MEAAKDIRSLTGFAVYDQMASAYAEQNENGAFNAFFERPSMLALLPEVRGLRILDLGAGPGGLAQKLVERGAMVTAVDGSAAMLDAAKARLGDAADFLLLDLDQGLVGIQDSTFEVVVSSLTIHYIADLDRLAAEIWRVLTPGGLLALSTHHPVMDFSLSASNSYFEPEVITDSWNICGRAFDVKFFRRPLAKTIQPFLDAGFGLETLSEGTFTSELKSRFPSEAERITASPYFLFLRFKKA